MQQVIQLDVFGRPSSLRMPAGKGIDLRKLGECSMTRVSDIELVKNQYEIHFRSNRVHVAFEHSEFYETTQNKFSTYEEAVATEISFVNSFLATGCKL